MCHGMHAAVLLMLAAILWLALVSVHAKPMLICRFSISAKAKIRKSQMCKTSTAMMILLLKIVHYNKAA